MERGTAPSVIPDGLDEPATNSWADWEPLPMNPFPDEVPVDDAVLDELTRQATFAADNAYLDNLGNQSLTPAAMTRLTVRAAIRNLIANRLVEVKSLDEIRATLEQGVTLR